MGGVFHFLDSVGLFQSPFLVQSHLSYLDSLICCLVKAIAVWEHTRSWESVVKLQGSNGTVGEKC